MTTSYSDLLSHPDTAVIFGPHGFQLSEFALTIISHEAHRQAKGVHVDVIEAALIEQLVQAVRSYVYQASHVLPLSRNKALH
jgi:hypothetical protein